MIVEIDTQSTGNVMKAFDLAVRLGVALSILSAPGLSAQDANDGLQIYWVDVEGGSATLLVTPAGETVLMDAGWNREDERDARRRPGGGAKYRPQAHGQIGPEESVAAIASR